MLPQTDERFTILPPPCSIMMGATSLMAKKEPLTLMSIIASNWVSVGLADEIGLEDAGRVDQDVDAPERRLHVGDQRFDRAHIAHVGDEGLGRPACRLDLLHDALCLGQVRGAGDGNARTLGGEPQRDRLADARGTAGDKRSLSLQSHDSLLPSLSHRSVNECRVNRGWQEYQPHT